MTLVPVIVRELQAEARRRMTMWLRPMGALVLLGTAFTAAMEQPAVLISGSKLFFTLQAALVIVVWLVVPVATADCISRERREGTLPLLFLTPLRAWHIITAKTLAHGLRAFSVIAATVPVLAVPALAGGVRWIDLVLSATAVSIAFILALAAGIFGSVLARSVGTAITLAALTAVCLIPIFLALCGTMAMGTFLGGFRTSAGHLIRHGSMFVLHGDVYLQSLQWRGTGTGRLSTSWGQEIILLIAVLAGALLVLLGVTLLAASILRRNWQTRPTSILQQRLARFFCTPVLAAEFLRAHLRRRLNRNPIVWLAQRSWKSRLVAWAWLAVVISLGTTAVTQLAGASGVFFEFQRVIVMLLAGSMALTAAGSFREERERGVLELLLVSPLGENELIWGRVRGVIGQFLPSALVLAASWIYLAGTFFSQREMHWMWTSAASLIALPMIGLYFALRCPTYFAAVAWTVGLGLLLPVVAREFIRFAILLCVHPANPISIMFLKIYQTWSAAGGEVMIQLVVAGICYRGLRARLRSREFIHSGPATSRK